MAGELYTELPVAYVHRVLFVVGPVEVDVPVWFGSWRNIGHQSISAACTLTVNEDATIMAVSKNAAVDQVFLFVFSFLLLSAAALTKGADILSFCNLLL